MVDTQIYCAVASHQNYVGYNKENDGIMAIMKTVQIYEPGDVNVLHYEDVELPEPQKNEVLVRVRAAGVNPVDYISRAHGLLLSTGTSVLPYSVGWDISGEVIGIGEGVTQFAIGDEVYGMPRFPAEARAYSEYITSPVADLALKPHALTHEEAAVIPLAGLTAWQALFEVAHLQAGQTLLITGGAGGVGHYAIQFAKWKGAKVLTTTSTSNVGFVRELGADTVIDYTLETLADAGQEADIVLDTIGAEVLREAFTVVKHGGFVVSLPGHKGVQALGEELAPDYGVSFALPLVHTSGEQLAQIARLADAGHLKTYVAATFPLKDAGQAHTLSEGGHVRGKLVLTFR